MFSKIQSLFAFSASALNWPEFTSDDLRLVAILAAFAILFAIEVKFGRKDQRNRTVRRSYLTNTGIFILNDTMMSLLSVSTLYVIADRYAEWGLFGSFSESGWKALLSFILLDVALYFWHRACHTVEWLWMFHKVHHSDRCVNVSTAFRLHFGEVLLTTALKAAFIVGMGMDASMVLANEAIITLFVLFHHTNARLPGERWLSRVIIAPSTHRLHHSVRREEHDLNFGAVFSVWDRMLGTFGDLAPEKIGLDRVREQNLLDLLKFGLIRTYTPSHQNLQAMIAEAAYYRAEKRGFTPGCDFRDWLEAEKEIHHG